MTVSFSAVVYAFAAQCVALFNKEPEVVSVGVEMVHIFAFAFWIMAIREVLTGYLRGHGRSFTPMVLSLLGMIGVRQFYLALTLLRAATPDIRKLYYCYPIGWGATMLSLLVYDLSVKHQLREPENRTA